MTLPVGNLGTRFGEGKMAFETATCSDFESKMAFERTMLHRSRLGGLLVRRSNRQVERNESVQQ
jgi:hypothetical protein